MIRSPLTPRERALLQSAEPSLSGNIPGIDLPRALDRFRDSIQAEVDAAASSGGTSIPSGPATGDLTGSYPNPSVALVGGVAAAVLAAHVIDTSNPHLVTAAQVGADSAGTAAAAVAAHTASANPHSQYALASAVGAPSGIATLDPTGNVPLNQLGNVTGGLEFQGTWNADTNTPPLTSGVGTDRGYYKVAAAGTTTLDGINDWGVGDWAIFTDSAGVWDKIDNSEAVSSVNGFLGAVVLTAANVGADPAGTAVAAVGTHTGEADPHPQYTTAAEASAAAPVQSVNGSTGIVNLTAADVGAEPTGTAAATVATHAASADPHPQYTTVAEAALEANAAVADHEGELDPHPQYTTAAEAAAASPVQSVNGATGAVTLTAANVGADPAGTAAGAVAAHEAAADPHSQYTTVAEASAAAPVQSVNGNTGAVSLGPVDVGADPAGTGAAEAAAAVSAHEAAADPHSQYTTVAEASAAAPVQTVNGQTGTVSLTAANVGADPLGAASSAVSTHEAAADPHPQYTTVSEAMAASPVQSVNGAVGAVVLNAVDVGADPAGTGAAQAASAVTAHEAEANPHSQYVQLVTVGAANGIATLDATGNVPAAQLGNVAAGLTFAGVWNADTNTPPLASSTGDENSYYKVSVAGTTVLDGEGDWGVGDWAIFSGGSWDKIDNTESVISVNGLVGAVTLTAANVGADPTGTAAAAVTTHEAAADPHSQYTTVAEAAAAAPVQSVNGATGAVTLTAGSVGADPVGTAASAVSAHEGTADPHPQYTTLAEAVTAAPVQSVNGNTGAVSLGPVDVGADPAGTASAAVAAHEGTADPHPQYTTPAEASAAAPVQTVNGNTGVVVLTSADVGADPAGTAASAVAAHRAAGIADHNDVAVTAPANEDVLQYNTTTSRWENGPHRPVPGTVLREAVAITPTTRFTTAAAGITVETLTFTPTVTGTYYLVTSYIWSYDLTTSDFLAEVRQDGVDAYQAQNADLTFFHRQEPKDAAGTGPAGTDQHHLATAPPLPVTLTAGTEVTFTLFIRPSVDGNEAAVYYTSMHLERIAQ